MDTTTDYRSLYLKKFFEWQEICGKQRAQIEELEKKLIDSKQIERCNNFVEKD